MNRNVILCLAVGICMVLLQSCQKGPRVALIETNYGNIKVELFDNTPGHKSNFVKLVESGFYDDLLFHRVINGFMIQGGDPDSKGAAPGVNLGTGGPGYTIPAEIGSPHIKGALAAARMGDAMNPKKASSGSQFYLVQGTKQSDQQLNTFELKKGIKYNETQRKIYQELGGTPMLDMEYTVFGQTIEGMDVIDKIAAVKTGHADRPVENVTMKIKMIK